MYDKKIWVQKEKLVENTPAARGLEELFFRCLRKVSPAHQRSAGVWYIVQEFGW
jgi:hypothetical protein